MKLTISRLKHIIAEVLEGSAEEEISMLQNQPEFQDLDSFIASKLDNDELSYEFTELQALARNLARHRLKDRRVGEALPTDIANVRDTLEKQMGFKYIPRTPVKNVRGIRSNAHGTHPFAGSGGGGSGFGSDFNGSTFTGYGGGPGAIGGGYSWDPNDPRNLGMSAKRRER